MKKFTSIFCAFCLTLGCVGASASAQTIRDEGRVAKTVWSGYWWPTAKQEILRPLAKYDALTGAASVEWERTNNPPTGVAPWVGLCHGWAAAAVMEDEPTRPLTSSVGTITVGDQKAWLSLAHGGDVANFYGRRFDGQPGDDPNDMAPETLWEALRTSVRDQKTSIVLDIEPGVEVWNYPVYAYRVDATKVGGNLYRGKIYVWFADDHVHPDFVGVKRFVQAYPFEIQTTSEGRPLHGTGRWIGSAVKSHPDFAWVPYVVRSGNDQLSYEKVCELLGRTPRGGEAPEIAPETVPSETDEDVADETPSETDGASDETSSETEDASASEEGSEETVPSEENSEETDASLEENVVAFSELEAFMQFVQEAGSDFDFDIRVDGYGRKLFLGDSLVLTGSFNWKEESKKERVAYLNVIAINPNGDLLPLYPQPGDDNRIEPGKQFKIPGDNAKYRLRSTEPFGVYKIRAFATERPIRFFAAPAIEVAEDGSKNLDWNAMTLRLTPAEKGMLVPEKRDAKPFDLGQCAYDEDIVYVGPKEEETPEKVDGEEK